MADADYTELLPLGPDETPYRLITTEGVSTFETAAGHVPQGRAGGHHGAHGGGDARHRPLPPPRPPGPAAHRPRRSRGQRQRPLRRPRPPQERGRRRRRRPADVPGHGHGHRQGQEGPVRVHRRRRRGRHRRRRPGDVPDVEPALQPDGAARRCTRSRTPAPTSRPRSRSPPSTATPTSSCSSPRAAAAPTSRTCTRRPRRCSTRPRCCPGSSRRCRRSAPRPARRTTSPSSSAARRPSSPSRRPSWRSTHYLDALPTEGSPLGHGFRDVELERKVLAARPADRHRRAVRRQVLLPRRPHHPPARATAPAARWRWPCRARADRQALGKITRTACSSSSSRPTRPTSSRPGELTDDDARGRSRAVHIDLNRPMAEILAELSKYPVRTRVMLTGPMVVARDIAHAKIKERLDAGEGCRSTCATTASTTPARRRRPRATRPARSARRRRGGWTATSSSSRPPADRW